MELALNLAWFLLTAWLLELWRRHRAHQGCSQRLQFAALAMVTVLLFPVISVSDDLLLAQSPAETDTTLRRDHTAAAPHTITPEIAALPLSILEAPGVNWQARSAADRPSLPLFAAPFAAALANRPPPAA